MKVVLDKRSLDNDDFIKDMVKIKFDKCWGKSNFLMSVAAVLDPRCKMRALEFCFLELYSSEVAEKEISHVRQPLQDLYSKYVVMYMEDDSTIEMLRDNYQSQHSNTSESSCGWSEYVDFLRSVESVQPQKSELDIYLEEKLLFIRQGKRLQCTRVVERSCIEVQDTINNGKRYFSHSDNHRYL